MTNKKLPGFCPLTGGNCGLNDEIISLRTEKQPYVFIMSPYGPEDRYDDLIQISINIINRKKLYKMKWTPIVAKLEEQVGSGACFICQLCWFSEFGISELGDLNVNVFLEIGYMFGFGKYVVFTLHKDHVKKENIPFDIENFMFVPYRSSLSLTPKLESKIDHVIRILNKRYKK